MSGRQSDWLSGGEFAGRLSRPLDQGGGDWIPDRSSCMQHHTLISLMLQPYHLMRNPSPNLDARRCQSRLRQVVSSVRCCDAAPPAQDPKTRKWSGPGSQGSCPLTLSDACNACCSVMTHDSMCPTGIWQMVLAQLPYTIRSPWVNCAARPVWMDGVLICSCCPRIPHHPFEELDNTCLLEI